MGLIYVIILFWSLFSFLSNSQAIKKPNLINFLSSWFFIRVNFKAGGLPLVWLTALANVLMIPSERNQKRERKKKEIYNGGDKLDQAGRQST